MVVSGSGVSDSGVSGSGISGSGVSGSGVLGSGVSGFSGKSWLRFMLQRKTKPDKNFRN
jgi:hypothetical protein